VVALSHQLANDGGYVRHILHHQGISNQIGVADVLEMFFMRVVVDDAF